jgi:two-component system response regulator YesN
MALHGYVYNMSVQQIVLLLRVSEAEKLDYCQLAEKLLDSLPAAPQGIAVRCAGSRLFSSPMSAGDEFAYCNNILLQYSDILSETSPAIIWSPKEYERCDSLYFPKKIYDQMTASIQAGERQKAADCLKEILRCNFSSSHPITPEMSTVLITRLKLIMMEAYREEMGFDLYKALKQIDALPSDAAKISVFIELTDKLCVYYQENLHQKTEKLRRKMTQYIDEQFTSPSFSLTEAASHCGFSDSYFSVLFREIMQENFSTYVDRLKMTLADRLIRETDLKIDEVARRVGYSDTNAFRRSYKKRFSISPSQRRSQQNS